MEIVRIETVTGERAESVRVETRDRCTLVFGPVPLSAFQSLVGKAPKRAVMSPDLCQLTGATLAFGLASPVNQLVRKLREERLANPPPLDALRGLSDGAKEWYLVGEHGESSLTIFTRVTGLCHPALGGETAPTHFPFDVDDLRRCRLLLEQAPDIAASFGNVMSSVSPMWRALTVRWGTLCGEMDLESPDWRSSLQTPCPQTHAILQTLQENIRS